MNMPHSFETEQTVLGSFILDNKISYKIRELKENNFFAKGHETIFLAMKKIINNNQPIDIVLLTNELRNSNNLEKVGGISYLTSLTTIVPTTSNIDNYIKILNDKLLKRQMINYANSLIEDISNDQSINDLALGISNLKDLITTNSSIQDNFIDASTVKKRLEPIKSLSTGCKKLDYVLSGLQYGTLTILTGKPSSGKSTVINQFIAETINSNNKTFLYTGELPTHMALDWFKRTVANDYHIEEQINAYNSYSYDVSEYADELIAEWIKDKFYIYSEDAISDEYNLLKTIEFLYLRKGVRLFVLDNLMTIKLGDRKDKYENQEQFTNNLKELAKKYGLVIILVAHPRKDLGDKKPDMYDVSGASEIVNLADYILSTYRNKNEDTKQEETSLLVLKNRIKGIQNVSIKMKFSEVRKRLYNDERELQKDYGYDLNKKYVQAVVPDDLF